MPNQSLINKTFIVPNRFSKLVTNTKISYSNIKKIKSELEDIHPVGIKKEFLNWIDSELGEARDKVDGPKRIKMDTGASGDKAGGNNYKDTHHKDKKNKNPTGLGGLIDVKSLSNPSNIFNNTANYLKEELDRIISLINKI